MAVEDDVHFDYALIVETNLYTGNFERELCAYATGSCGECDVGRQLAERAVEELTALGHDEYVLSSFTAPWVKDDNGCARPVSIWNAEGNQGYNDLIIFLDYPFRPALFELVKERIEAYAVESRANKDRERTYSAAERRMCDAGDLHIKKMYMIKRTITIVDTPQEPLDS